MQRVAILYDASQAALSTFDRDEVLGNILKIIRDYFHIHRALIMLVDRENKELYCHSLYEEKPTLTIADIPRRSIGVGLIGDAARLKRPVYVPDVAKDIRYIRRFATTQSELAIPLMVRDDVVGVLDLQSDSLAAFDDETIDLLTLFSTHASSALENARLYSNEQRRSRQLEAINLIARQTTAVVELQELLDKFCSLILEKFPVDQVTLLLLESEDLVVRAQNGRLKMLVEMGHVVKAGKGLCHKALNSSQTIFSNDVSQEREYLQGYAETRSEICIPLIFFGEKLGALILDSDTLNAFQPDDVQVLESAADICAAAIRNAYHFQAAQQLAYLDGLTGIFNRRFFELRILEEIERALRYNTNLSVIMVDIDHFKKLNDEFLHLLGDEVLRQVAHVLTQQLRKGDVVCRYGGEEFAILLPQTNGQNAMDVAEKIRRAVESFHFPGVPRPVTISAGVASCPQFGLTRDQLVSAADSALYAAKQGGRNRVKPASLGN